MLVSRVRQDGWVLVCEPTWVPHSPWLSMDMAASLPISASSEPLGKQTLVQEGIGDWEKG